MKVLLTKGWTIEGRARQAGEVVRVDEAAARRIVEHGSGLAMEPFATPHAREIPPPELTGETHPVAPAEGQIVTRTGAAEVRRVATIEGRTVEVDELGRAS